MDRMKQTLNLIFRRFEVKNKHRKNVRLRARSKDRLLALARPSSMMRGVESTVTIYYLDCDKWIETDFLC